MSLLSSFLPFPQRQTMLEVHRHLQGCTWVFLQPPVLLLIQLRVTGLAKDPLTPNSKDEHVTQPSHSEHWNSYHQPKGICVTQVRVDSRTYSKIIEVNSISFPKDKGGANLGAAIDHLCHLREHEVNIKKNRKEKESLPPCLST